MAYLKVTKKLFKDSFKAPLKTFTIDPDSWKAEAQDRYGRRAAVHKGAQRCEASGYMQRSSAGRSGKIAPSLMQLPQPLAYTHRLHCTRLFHAWIGFTSHILTHFTNQTPPPRRGHDGHRRYRRTNGMYMYLCMTYF